MQIYNNRQHVIHVKFIYNNMMIPGIILNMWYNFKIKVMHGDTKGNSIAFDKHDVYGICDVSMQYLYHPYH